MRTKQESKVDEFAQVAAAVDAAELTKRNRSQALADAKTHAASLRGRLSTGDETVTAEDLVRADHEVERARLLYQAASTDLDRVKAAQPFPPRLAEAIVPALTRVLRVPVEVVKEAPTIAPESLPSAYLRQPQKHTSDIHTGYLAGVVNLGYVRSDLHADVVASKLEERISKEQLGVVVRDRGTRTLLPGVELQQFRLEISRAWEEIPVIAGERPSDWRIRGVGPGIATGVERNSEINGRATVKARGNESLRSAEIDQGLRLSIIEVDLTAWPVNGWWSLEEVLQRLQREIQQTVGKPLSGIGRCTGATVERTGPVPGGSVGAKARLECVSRIADAV